MLADLRFALRVFARNPLFSAAVVLVLGLGIGASTTVFTLVDAYLLKPLPFEEPERLVSVWRKYRFGSDYPGPFSAPDLLDVKAQAASFSRLTALRSIEFNLSEGAGSLGREAAPEHVTGCRVDGDFFATLGAKAAQGRVFTPDEDVPGRARVVVLSDALWRRRFGKDPSIVGKVITFDGEPYQVVGVMPPGFVVPRHLQSTAPAEFWVPAALTYGDPASRDWHSWHMIGRLKPGVSFEGAEAEVGAIAARLEQAYADTNTNKLFFLVGLHEHLSGGIKSSLLLLFVSTLLLLFIASANVALLLLAQASAREGEAAVRAALGASRPRLLRQFLTESLLLALSGGALGFALSFVGVTLMASGYEGAAHALREVRPDGRVFLFALALGSVAGVGFGLVPALRASGARLYGLLKEGAARSSEGGRRRRLQAGLLVAEIALSAVLLAGSMAVAKGFSKILGRPMGFSAEHALTFRVHLPEARYRDGQSARSFLDNALRRLGDLPSAGSVGAANFIPLVGTNTNGGFEIEGKPPWPAGRNPWTEYQRASVDYFRSMQISLRRGRLFTDADREGSQPVMIVSESFADKYMPGEDPVGKRVRWGDGGPFREVVGVVADVTYSPGSRLGSSTYIPFSQEADRDNLDDFFFVVRSEGDPLALANAARDALRQIDSELPLADVKTYDMLMSRAFSDRRFTLVLVSAFAGSALLLTALGLFGLVAYQTRRRSRELAIRMALGAASADVERLVVRDTSRLLVAGLALGLPAAFVAGRLLASSLEGVPPADLLSLAVTALLLGLVALLASAVPARRAARTSPALVLRND